MITNKHNEECSCALFDRQTLNAGAGSWTTSMDWHCPVHGQQHRDYKKPEGWEEDWTPQKKHEWSQSIKHAMNKTNPSCPYHTLPNPEDDGPSAAGNQIPSKSKYDDPNYKSNFDKFVEVHPITDVSWEAEVKKCFLTERMTDWPIPTVRVNPDTLMEIIKHQIDRAREESKHITKSGRVMYMEGRKKAIAEMKNIITKNEQAPTLCGECNLNGPLCKECYANRRANSVLSSVLTVLEALSNK